MPVFADPGGKPPDICERAVQVAAESGRDVILFDTAGRLAIDEPLMQELTEIDARVHPANIFLVVDAMIGQDAVGTAKAFNERLNLDGVILTKLDGDARGGAALSVKEVTGKPIKFLGMGEASTSSRSSAPTAWPAASSGMGDIVGLIKDFEEVVDEEKAEEDAVRMLKGKFDMKDFLEQIRRAPEDGLAQGPGREDPGHRRRAPRGRPAQRRRAGAHRGDDLVDDRRRAPPPRALRRHQLGRGRRGRQAQEEAQRVLRHRAGSRASRAARGAASRRSPTC